MLAEKAEFPVKMMARVLGVSRSGFYSWLSNGCPRENWSAEREAVRRVWLESDRRFGFRFVKCFLPGEFSGLTLYRMRKLMHELGIRGCTPNARKRTTIPDPKARPRPDLVSRDFTSPVPTYKLVATSPTCAPARDGCTCRRSSTSTPAWWWAGRSPSE